MDGEFGLLSPYCIFLSFTQRVLSYCRSCRIVECGQVSQYNLTLEERYPIRNTFLAVGKCLTMTGFMVCASPAAVSQALVLELSRSPAPNLVLL